MDTVKTWKLITNQLSPKEAQETWAQIMRSPEDLAAYKKLKAQWSLTEGQQLIDNDGIEQKLKEFKLHYRKLLPPPTKWLYFSRYAAVAIILLSSLLVWQQFKLHDDSQIHFSHFESGKGSINKVLLADGSVIWLNANSHISLVKQNEHLLEMDLSGEALFEVVHNENRRFIVHTQQLKIEDLGTRFNIRSYAEDQQVTATLIEGEIEVSEPQSSLREILSPGQQLIYSLKDKQYTLNTVDTSTVGRWKEAKFEFIDKTLREIARDLENWYGVSITFKNKELEKERFTGVIQKSTPLEKVLDILSYSSDIKYHTKQTPNGTEIMIQ
ncbi:MULTISPECIES: FecR family protein [unclassified Carboxylicivirga]|uniref:FecR family protein n=1 Tax=Carboxylicivirga TaxID=1628153 RepID=UPI003D35321C